MQSVTAKLVAGTNYQVEVTSGSSTIVSDQPTKVGGTDKGANPKAVLLASIIACTIQTIKSVEKARKWDLQEINGTASLDEVDDPNNPGTLIAQIEVTLEIKGSLTAAELSAIERTAGRCPVLKLVEGPKLVVKKVTKI